MVYPPAYTDEPIVKDTKIDQSILDELFEVKQIKRYQSILDQASDVINSQRFDEIASFQDYEEKEDPKIEDINLPELPDLTEYEDRIHWTEPPDAEHLTDGEKKFYYSNQD